MATCDVCCYVITTKIEMEFFYSISSKIIFFLLIINKFQLETILLSNLYFQSLFKLIYILHNLKNSSI